MEESIGETIVLSQNNKAFRTNFNRLNMKRIFFLTLLNLLTMISFGQTTVDSCKCHREVVNIIIETFMPILSDSNLLCNEIKKNIVINAKPDEVFEAVGYDFILYINKLGNVAWVGGQDDIKDTHYFYIKNIKKILKSLRWQPAYRNTTTKEKVDKTVNMYFHVFSSGKVEIHVGHDNAYQEQIFICETKK